MVFHIDDIPGATALHYTLDIHDGIYYSFDRGRGRAIELKGAVVASNDSRCVVSALTLMNVFIRTGAGRPDSIKVMPNEISTCARPTEQWTSTDKARVNVVIERAQQTH